MKTITLKNYTTDKYYPKIVKAVDAELQSRNFVTPIEVFISMGLLERRDVENWRAGRIFYLEQVVKCNLSKASRILRILRFHAHDLNLKPSMTVYPPSQKATGVNPWMNARWVPSVALAKEGTLRWVPPYEACGEVPRL